MTTQADPRDVKRLADKVADSRKYRAQEEATQKMRSQRLSEINEAPESVLTDFWCDHPACRKDFSTLGYKHLNWVHNIETGMNEPPEIWRAWYAANCPSGHRCIKRITDKQYDPYYYQSNKVRKMQRQYADEMLTPDDPRFKTIYPQQWARIQDEIRDREVAQWGEQKAEKRYIKL